GREQLEPALDRRQQLDRHAEVRARVRIERHDAPPEPGRLRDLEHALMPAMDAVEAPDRDRACCRLELPRRRRDDHAGAPMRASTSASARSAAGSNAAGSTASATLNGPTSVRRSV